VSARSLLGLYALLNAALYVYAELRFGYSAFDWICIGFVVLLIALLWRGSRGAWLLSFVGSAPAFAIGAVSVGDWSLEWLAFTGVLGAQVLILLTPQVRCFVRQTAYTRAIRAHRSW
jgi:hypothetical protein